MMNYKLKEVENELLENRIIQIYGEITDDTAQDVVSKLLYLEIQDSQDDITILLNTPGGSVSAGFAIIDIMNNVECNINTYACGLVASIGSIILSCGVHRKAYPNAEIMLHQPMLTGLQGKASDIEVTTQHLLKIKERINKVLSKNTKQDVEKIIKLTEKDYWLSAKEALEFGIIDEVIGDEV